MAQWFHCFGRYALDAIHLTQSFLWYSNSRQVRPSWTTRQDLEEDIETYSDEDEQHPSSSAAASSRGRTRKSGVRHVRDPSWAANVVTKNHHDDPPNHSQDFSPTQSNGNWFQRSARNDLSGGSGVGAGQYELVAAQAPPVEPAPSRSSRRRGRGKKRTSSSRKRTSSTGAGRGRRKGFSTGRGRGRGRGRGGARGNQYSSATGGSAWSDYASQSAPWASQQQPPSNLGNVGGAEISF